MVARGSVKDNDDDDGSVFREEFQDEGGRGSTGKDADDEDVNVELDGEGIAIPSSSTGDRYRVRDKDNGQGSCGRCCASA